MDSKAIRDLLESVDRGGVEAYVITWVVGGTEGQRVGYADAGHPIIVDGLRFHQIRAGILNANPLSTFVEMPREDGTRQ